MTHTCVGRHIMTVTQTLSMKLLLNSKNCNELQHFFVFNEEVMNRCKTADGVNELYSLLFMAEASDTEAC